MTKDSTTPGPWGVEQTDTTNWIGPMRRSGDGKVESIVCSTEREGLRADVRRRNDANARLIAAAPELLEALKYFAEGMRTSVAAVAVARAAIAKAEGAQ